MSSTGLADLLVRQLDRLAPQDAEQDRSHRRRHKHRSGEKEQRNRDEDRGYKSDDGHRRRDEKSREEHGHRARSSHRSTKEDPTDDGSGRPRHRRKSSHRSKSRRRDDDDWTDEGDSTKKSRRDKAFRDRHAEPQLHDSDDSSQLNGPSPSKPSSRPPRQLGKNVSVQREYDEHHLQQHELAEEGRFQIDAVDHYPTRNEYVPNVGYMDPRVTRPHEYGDHRIDDSALVHYSQDVHKVPQPTTDGNLPRIKNSNTREHYGDLNLANAQSGGNIPLVRKPRDEKPDTLSLLPVPAPLSNVQTHPTEQLLGGSQYTQSPSVSVSRGNGLPPEHRQSRSSSPLATTDSDSYSGGSTDHDGYAPRSTMLPLTPASTYTSTVPFADAQLPRLSVSQYPSSLTPSDSNSGIGAFVGRPRSRSASSTTSFALLSPTTLAMGSGVLGPKTYQYQSLGEMEFRLVRILPERMSKLKCEIVHQSLDDAPDYVAISYAWGDGVDTKLLILEGASVPITGSLYDALKAVRQKKQETLVWVDALCIDQNNRDERATQVRLMGLIYSKATSVAIWLGPEANKSTLAMQLLQQVADNTVSKQRVQAVRQYADSEALLALFKKRDYWKRLWVVQEVLLAEKKMVYCGYSVFPWETYRQAAEAFWPPESDPHIRHGPSSFPDKSLLAQLGDESLLEVMRACRRKLSENPRDKVFGILGMLPEDTQREFPVDYSQSVKTVYTDVVDYTISTSDRLDVIRESIHFPLHVNTLGLPSWCPDWSHIPEVSGLGRTHGFEASRSAEGPTEARYRFYDERRKLKISAIKLDTVNETGVAVGTFCASQDYLTAFLDWRAIMLHEFKIEEGNESHPMHEAFCRTLCLGQMPEQQYDPKIWRDLCYHTFSSLIRERLPRLPIDEDLARYVAVTGLIEPTAQRKFLQDHFGNRMMGRSFCITEQGLVGMGCGYMMADDIIVVPFGCSTPILLRADGCRDEYRYIGDIYVDGYMHGEAVQEMEANDPRRIPADYMLI